MAIPSFGGMCLVILTMFTVPESIASENASRLASMRGTERNIGDRISELSLRYHQQRQMAITEELLDITGGFEAMADQEGENS